MTPPAPKITQREALEACEGDGFALQMLVAAGYDEKVALAKLEGLVRKGLADYGVSAAGAWLTDAGRQRLTELREVDG